MCCFNINNICAKSNDTLLTLQLLERIQTLQMSSDGVFPKGTFPTYRTYALNKDRQKADNNAFYTGLIVFTLENIKSKLTNYQQQIVENISSKARPTFTKFKNQNGRNTYNFWPTDTPVIFPNSGWMNLFNKRQALPDDLDDTVMILMALNEKKSTADSIHQLMQLFANNTSKKINSTLSSLSEIPAYSVWFGKKMPIDFDISVLANVLYFVSRYQLPYTHADSASVELIEKILKENIHLSEATVVSPHYGTPEIILYHLSRLMASTTIPALENFKPDLIQQAISLQQNDQPLLNHILLSSSLINWGVKPDTRIVPSVKSLQETIENENFSFFIANMASMLPLQLKKILTASTFGKFQYYCPAYNNVLFLENIVLYNSINQ
jgi:hypothetical protein